ncbi:hypothetical protein WN944_026052 [Citrus x changshan-huyou]|uniref:Uncharacterized protein n=1 Tax=Citrus x changshan-huyou TaxID=2935761 RepID=A0AAP0LQY3_9ROSI
MPTNSSLGEVGYVCESLLANADFDIFLSIVMQRKHSKLVLQELGGNKKMKESGFIIPQGIPSHSDSWMKRGLDATLNRYGIRPGRQWDGVNHSLMDARTKCSKELMQKQAKEREAYLRSVTDM